MTVKRRRIQKNPAAKTKPSEASPAQEGSAPGSSAHELSEDVFSAEEQGQPLSETKRFFITLTVVAVLFLLIFAVLQSVR
jgi:hypothetical protein